MKKLYITALFSILGFNAYTQENLNCIPQPLNENQQLDYNIKANAYHASGKTIDINEVRYLPLKIHIVSKDDKTGGLVKKDINEFVSKVCKYYRYIGVQFFISEYNLIHNSTFFDLKNPSSDESLMAEGNDSHQAINIYFVNSIKDDENQCEGTFGYAYLPFDNIKSTRIVLKNCAVVGDMTAIHEFGHFFGLKHTYNDEVNNLGDRFIENKDNCDIVTDGLCSTDTDPGANFTTPNWDRRTCTFTEEIRDRNGAIYTPPVRNMMSNYTGCQQEFVPEQIEKMKEGLAVRGMHNSYDFSASSTNVLEPSELSATKNIYNSNIITWKDNADNETGYIIERALIDSNEFIAIGGTTPNETTFIDNDVNSDRVYKYRLRPSNSSQPGPAFFLQDNTILNTEKINSSYVLSPVPTDEILNINGNNIGDKLNITISDINGKVLISTQKSMLNEGINVDLSSFTNGPYFITIENLKTGKIEELKALKK
ncbi:T9SS type A sorting domain-containing protein [Aureibacter tunicatorum]|uniref:Fibronectin type-III domain-containing protein n=1 Tax=Aureibacter tunicatorum TaxID=866807 RepID=A0AAE3XQC8_9BACT|nr:T9SS type A sorting domain-containing protein [Aureibacter tunicatorum]MDR6240104.1 hypothetical protein [Aureibacter tunicatorum]BDD06015.1 hypothetical protein AUTU_34980 [Aureibacter tunicatorum]